MNYDKLVLTDENNFKSIADAIRKKKHDIEKIKIESMANAINSIETGFDIKYQLLNDTSIDIDISGEYEEWTRPVEWPDILSIPIDYQNDEEVLYLIYNNDHLHTTIEQCWAGFAFSSDTIGTYLRIEKGIVSNGAFISSTQNQSSPVNKTGISNVIYAADYYGDINSNYVIYKIVVFV